MDIQKRDALLGLIGDVNGKRSNCPLVTLEQFFEGNDDGGSIWCNLPASPNPAKVYEILRGIRDREDVADVRIMVTQYDGDDCWPFSDTIYFIAQASEDEVIAWLGEDFRPDEVWSGDGFGPRAQALDVPADHNVVGAWWD